MAQGARIRNLIMETEGEKMLQILQARIPGWQIMGLNQY